MTNTIFNYQNTNRHTTGKKRPNKCKKQGVGGASGMGGRSQWVGSVQSQWSPLLLVWLLDEVEENV